VSGHRALTALAGVLLLVSCASGSAAPPTERSLPPADAAVAVTPALAPGPAGDGRLTMAFMGDALWHSPLWRQAEQNYTAAHPGAAGRDFAPMLAPLHPLLESVDLAVCHLETPIAPEGEAFSTHPLYGVPPEVVPAIAAAGFDRCSTASNHTIDRGPAGIDRTVAVLEAHGVGQSGMARTPEEAQPSVFLVDGVHLAHLSYTYGLNGLRIPAGLEWKTALIHPPTIIADAARARELGAQVVVVSLHWGVEGQAAVSDSQRRIAEEVTGSGHVDLIVGHHAHVLQPVEQINGTWVVFGLGNMISNLPTSDRWPRAAQDGAVAVVEVTIGADGAVAVAPPVIHPTWVDKDDGWIVHLVGPALRDPALSERVRGQLEVSMARTDAVLAGFVARG
jgi:hypothetical protein